MLRKFLAAAAVVFGVGSIALAATPLKVGVSAGPYADILRFTAEKAKKDGIDAEIIEFTDWTLPNEALNAGDIDLNNFQHQPYLDNQVKTRGYDLVSVARSIIVPFGLYSKKLTSLAAIKDGATTAIPNDPSNAARGLQLLEKAGLIKLKPGAGAQATVADIVANPKHLKIQELDAAQLPRALDDLDFSVVSLNYALTAGLDPKKALLLEDDHSQWNLVFAVKTKNKDNPAIKRFIEIYRSSEVKAYILNRFNGTILATW
ncbi:MetQ/NlpA family ABC transporter substrate-binding protein [uncultured Rhodoblastus sp.]|uniref:MetQ/NlpA family ABC transporter substrate-binding protein n=1 Tax=uncultured Rhodoblastus sp. TaxID=543037 RepID=UPI0025EE7823|nr:MetQ/NlpA family ABC transporter substrate-binding protein [uncultured Rhodoblastus sp.]